jgi:hypothetical protein
VVDVITGELTKQVLPFVVQYSDVSGNPIRIILLQTLHLYDETITSVNFLQCR